jgi:hypothetical protein
MACPGRLLVSIGILAVRITPRRLSDFRRHLDARSAIAAEAFEEGEEEKIIDELSHALRSQRDGLQRAVRTSVLLGIAGLGLAVAYVVDKGFYGP